MNAYVLALGSNQGDRLENLHRTLGALKKLGRVRGVSPLTENPPWLPPQAPKDWFHFFLNTALVLETDLSPKDLLQQTKKIEIELGRKAEHEAWSPRSIDIDLVLELHGLQTQETDLHLPHPHWENRNFVLAPLVHLLPHLPPDQKALSLYRREKRKLPYLMGIVNATPDSFSNHDRERSRESLLQSVYDLFKSGVSYIDVGAESTRPGAQVLKPETEWERLKPVLDLVKELKPQHPFVKVSLDTYHPETAEKALDFRVDILNDVQGLENPRMQDVAKNYESVIVMHSLTIPADKNVTWPEDVNPVNEMRTWLEQKLDNLSSIGNNKIIWDPGFGFGKTPAQSLELVKNFSEFKDLPVRSLVGHSRKSFMNIWTDKPFHQRDPETLAASALLLNQGADILRVHNVPLHQEFFRSWTSLENIHG